MITKKWSHSIQQHSALNQIGPIKMIEIFSPSVEEYDPSISYVDGINIITLNQRLNQMIRDDHKGVWPDHISILPSNVRFWYQKRANISLITAAKFQSKQMFNVGIIQCYMSEKVVIVNNCKLIMTLLNGKELWDILDPLDLEQHTNYIYNNTAQTLELDCLNYVFSCKLD